MNRFIDEVLKLVERQMTLSAKPATTNTLARKNL